MGVLISALQTQLL